jgi:hypothetical protein
MSQELENRALNYLTRRHFLRECTTGMGMMALGSMLGSCENTPLGQEESLAKLAHILPKAKRVIYIHKAGSPSQLELFDYKPELVKWHGKDCPAELLKGKTFAFIRGVPKMLGPQGKFNQFGQSGAWVSDYLPYFQNVVDEVCFLKAMHTDQFNHAPAQLFMQTGSARLGRPGMGAWAVYGLGSENANLPGFIVLTSGNKYPEGGKSIWGSGFLPSIYQGVHCRSTGEPVLYVENPSQVSRENRRSTIDAINEINQREYEEYQDPEILTRISQYEMAFKMQASVPEVMDIRDEPEYIHNLYGTTIGTPSFANNCLLARKLAENGVRFIQLYDWGWDTHGSSASEALEIGLRTKCKETDQGMSALLFDLKQRGLLDETLVVWSGEFGRTPMSESGDGRDHNPWGFSMWFAGGGVKAGSIVGSTDDIGLYAVDRPAPIKDIHASILRIAGLENDLLTYKHNGRDERATVTDATVIDELLA